MISIKIVCQRGISILYFFSFSPINQIVKQIFTTGDISRPKTAIKLAKKSGILNHFKSIFIKESINAILQIMANLAIKAKNDLLNKLPMSLNSLQDKKIT